MVWDDSHLYIAAELADPNVRGRQTERDSVVYFDNDFEIFIDPDGDRFNYFEIEINALNTIFDLYLTRPYNDRGAAFHDWNFEGLRSAVFVDGTINDATDRDRGWTLEVAIPWSSFVEIVGILSPPRVGDTWRINFARVQWPDHIDLGSWDLYKQAQNWSWSPQGEVNMHNPTRWGYVTFVAE